MLPPAGDLKKLPLISGKKTFHSVMTIFIFRIFCNLYEWHNVLNKEWCFECDDVRFGMSYEHFKDKQEEMLKTIWSKHIVEQKLDGLCTLGVHIQTVIDSILRCMLALNVTSFSNSNAFNSSHSDFKVNIEIYSMYLVLIWYTTHLLNSHMLHFSITAYYISAVCQPQVHIPLNI